MQCKPVSVLPSGEKWTFEIKLDGYRCIAVKGAGDVTLFSRHEKVLNRRFPGVVQAITSLDGDFVLDGELVALDPQGKPSFRILQHNMSQSLPIYCYAFDLLNQNGELLVNLPLSSRREALETVLPHPRIRCACLRCCRHQPGKFLRRFASSAWKVSSGNEWIPSMKQASDSAHGSSAALTWFVIGGYVPGARGFDALVVGVYENKELSSLRR